GGACAAERRRGLRWWCGHPRRAATARRILRRWAPAPRRRCFRDWSERSRASCAADGRSRCPPPPFSARARALWCSCAMSWERSSALVRGAFWGVAASVTVSVLVEHAVIHGTAHTIVPATGSAAIGLVGAAVATTAVSPAAAFTISIVYERLERAGECPPNSD